MGNFIPGTNETVSDTNLTKAKTKMLLQLQKKIDSVNGQLPYSYVVRNPIAELDPNRLIITLKQPDLGGHNIIVNAIQTLNIEMKDSGLCIKNTSPKKVGDTFVYELSFAEKTEEATAILEQ